MIVQALVSEASVEGFDKGILDGLSWLNELDFNISLVSSVKEVL